MNKVLVTGANGFIGRNLIEGLRRIEDIAIKTFDVSDESDVLKRHLQEVDIVFHLAGVNRPEKNSEFTKGNVDLTQTIVNILEETNRNIPVVLSSSIQALRDNPYGSSKKMAEHILIEYSKKNLAKIYIYRFPNVFGKWCRPNYNSVVATFCYNISRGIDIFISDENREIKLLYIDDIIDEFLKLLTEGNADKDQYYYKIERNFIMTLGYLAKKIYLLRDIRKTLVVPDLSDDFMKCLHATYISFLDKSQFSYQLEMKRDHRGWLAELIKSPHFGQIFVSKTHKGIVRGHHYHNSKIEKFCVIQGKAVIRFRHLYSDEIVEYRVSGKNIEVLDIPPGYSHSIENLSDGEMIVLFWANQIYDPNKPDTYHSEV